MNILHNDSQDQHDISLNSIIDIIQPILAFKNEIFLEIGDMFPFIKVGSKDMHNIVDSKFIIFICVQDISSIDIDLINILNQKYNLFIIYNTNNLNLKNIHIGTQSNKINNILKIPECNYNVYILNSNRKIVDLKVFTNLSDLNDIDILEFNKYNRDSHVPYLIIENVLSPELLDEILKFYDDNINNALLHNSISKNRLHVHPDKKLEKKIDNKLSRSLFPEIRKIFNFEVKYRELYKIASYNAETNGRFHAHRDTPIPFQHRRYALSLFLNEDYEGGEFELPEYKVKFKLKTNSALIFPGICSHKINEITKGSRKVMISFFCSEIEGKTKNNIAYKVKSNFFDEKKIKYSEIFPF